MDSISRDIYRLMRQRRAAGLARLPLSLSFETGWDRRRSQPRPSSLHAGYPSIWFGPDGVRDQRMTWHRHGRRDGQRGRCLCCGRVEGRRYWVGGRQLTVRLQLAHMGWQPDDLCRVQLLPLCEQCHQAWDALHCDCAAALTLAGEGRLPAHVLGVLRHAIWQDVGGYGLVQLSPAVMDLAVALTLRGQGGMCPRDGLRGLLAEGFPEVVRALQEHPLPCGGDEVEAVLDASLARLAMRRVARGGCPFVMVRDQNVRLTPSVSLPGWVSVPGT